MAALIPLCFTLLGDTAEFYFSPIMAHVSQSIPKMRPRFAGGARCGVWRPSYSVAAEAPFHLPLRLHHSLLSHSTCGAGLAQ